MAYICNKMLELRIKLIKELDAKKIKQQDIVDLLDVSRQTVSKWLARYRVEGEAGLTPKKSGPKNGTTWNKTPKEIEDKVCELAQDNPYKGPDWIADEMAIKINQSTVYRILKRRGIRYHERYRSKKRKKKAYCLDMPGRELQLDVCFPFGYARKEVVYDVIDDCSRYVFARVMLALSCNSSIAFIKEVLKTCPFPIKAIRTDQGREFGAKFTAFLKEHGIEHKKNPAYTPQHNGKIERYHRTFKELEVCYWPFNASRDELNYRLSLWLTYYNYTKKHTGLGMNKLTPVQKISYALIQNSFNKNVNLTLQQYKSLQLTTRV